MQDVSGEGVFPNWRVAIDAYMVLACLESGLSLEPRPLPGG